MIMCKIPFQLVSYIKIYICFPTVHVWIRSIWLITGCCRFAAALSARGRLSPEMWILVLPFQCTCWSFALGCFHYNDRRRKEHKHPVSQPQELQGWRSQFIALDFAALKSGCFQNLPESTGVEESAMWIALGGCSDSFVSVCLATPVHVQSLPWGLFSILPVQPKPWCWHWSQHWAVLASFSGSWMDWIF